MVHAINGGVTPLVLPLWLFRGVVGESMISFLLRMYTFSIGVAFTLVFNGTPTWSLLSFRTHIWVTFLLTFYSLHVYSYTLYIAYSGSVCDPWNDRNSMHQGSKEYYLSFLEEGPSDLPWLVSQRMKMLPHSSSSSWWEWWLFAQLGQASLISRTHWP